jgi:hypothetical protein
MYTATKRCIILRHSGPHMAKNKESLKQSTENSYCVRFRCCKASPVCMHGYGEQLHTTET